MTLFGPSTLRLRAWVKRWQGILPMMIRICLAGTASSMLTTSVSLAVSNPAVAPWIVQTVLTAYPIGFLLGCLVTRPVVSRIGHERAFTFFTLISAVAALGFALTDFMPAWFVFRLFGGLAMSALFVVCESWINIYAEQHNRGTLFSFYMLTTAMGVLLGQLFVALAGPHSLHLFGIATTIALLAFLAKFLFGPWPVSPLGSSEPIATAHAQNDEPLGLIRLFRLAPVTVVTIFQAGITNLNIFVLTPLYGAGIGLSAATTVWLVTTISVACMAAQTPVGWLSDRFDRRVILLIQGLLSVFLCAAIAWCGNSSEPLLFFLFFAYACTALTMYPVAIAFANSQLHSRQMVAAAATLLLLHSIGNILTPGLAAGLMERTVPEAMLLVLGAGGIFVAIAACFNLMHPSLRTVSVRGAEP